MASFAVQVLPVLEVVNHPDADRLTLNTVLGYTAISNKHDDGSWRYNAGDLVVYIPEDAVICDEALKFFGFWDDTKHKGIFNGSRGNRVKSKRLRGIFSTGVLLPVYPKEHPDYAGQHFILNHKGEALDVAEGDDVAEFLGIKKYEVEVPAHFAGKCVGERNNSTMKFDVENERNARKSEWQYIPVTEWDGKGIADEARPAPEGMTGGVWVKRTVPLLNEDMIVSITSKIHGTSFAVFSDVEEVTNPNLAINGKNLYAASKGLEARGIVFENTPENIETNVYVKMLNAHAHKFEELAKAVRVLTHKPNAKIIIRSEIYGPGVQKGFDYGATEHEYRVFAIYVDKVRLNTQTAFRLAEYTGHKTAPCLYYGPWNAALAEQLRDGPEPIAGRHIQEGVVVTVDGIHPKHGDIMLKMVSPEYLILAGKAKDHTEYQ